jgi:putative phosphonate metabolism protein
MAEINNNGARFAIYFSPRRESLLFELGSNWLGRNAIGCDDVDPVLPQGLSVDDWRRATESPRRYGFHATLKPPFRLAKGSTYEELRHALCEFAKNHKRFEAPRIQVSPLGRFLALTLSEPSPQFSEFAAECVTEFDRFRAAPTEPELALRLRDCISSREREHVRRWGYPYVFDTWKFHMSLTGSLPPESLPPLHRILMTRFEPTSAQPLLVDSICIFQEPYPGGPFRLIEEVDLEP